MSLSSSDRLIRTFVAIQRAYSSRLGSAVLAHNLGQHQLRLLAEQVYLQEKWPSHIAHVYLGLDDRALASRPLVRYILSIIQSENLGLGSNGVPHADLARRFARSVGVSSKRLDSAVPTPPNRLLMDWCDLSALDRPWLESLAVHVACESQAPLMKAVANGLLHHYGLARRDAQFWLVHGGRVEERHARTGRLLIARHCDAPSVRGVLYAFESSCRLVCEFYDSVLEA
jgi:pyrroloquinoline quinone (PQQ) biosynthesis protein C